MRFRWSYSWINSVFCSGFLSQRILESFSILFWHFSLRYQSFWEFCNTCASKRRFSPESLAVFFLVTILFLRVYVDNRIIWRWNCFIDPSYTIWKYYLTAIDCCSITVFLLPMEISSLYYTSEHKILGNSRIYYSQTICW